MFCSSFSFSIVLIKCVVSLMYEGRRTTACFIQWSKNLDMFEVMLLTHEHIGLIACGVLWSLRSELAS